MIYAGPGTEVTAIFNGFASGLEGTAGVRIEDAQGDSYSARVTTGIVESPDDSGIYVVTLTAPTQSGYFSVIFDNGAGTLTPGDFAVEEMRVSFSGPADSEVEFGPSTEVETLADLRDLFYRELSEELQAVVPTDRVDGWLNDGRPHLGYYIGQSTTLTWSEGDYLIDLPVDYCEFDSIDTAVGEPYMPAFRVWQRKLRLECPATVGGTATLFYGSYPPLITGDAPSVLPGNMNRALVSYALYRFLRWLASSRADYRRYSTIAQGNAADVTTLLSIAGGYRQDFIEHIGTQKLDAPVTFFGE